MGVLFVLSFYPYASGFEYFDCCRLYRQAYKALQSIQAAWYT